MSKKQFKVLDFIRWQCYVTAVCYKVTGEITGKDILYLFDATVKLVRNGKKDHTLAARNSTDAFYDRTVSPQEFADTKKRVKLEYNVFWKKK